jgi:hypothetical protein
MVVMGYVDLSLKVTRNLDHEFVDQRTTQASQNLSE